MRATNRDRAPLWLPGYPAGRDRKALPKAGVFAAAALLLLALAPTPALAQEPEAEGRGARTLELSSADGTRLHALLFEAETPVAGLVMVHGMQSHAGWFEAAGTADQLAAAGITSLAYDRRGSGRSGGERGHTSSPEEMLADLDAARSALRRELEGAGAAEVPLHALANCFGTRIVLPYLDDNEGAFASVTLTAPATHMSPLADYGTGKRLKILAAREDRTFATPLKDEYFVSEGEWLEWIQNDPYSLREVTAAFLKSTNKLTSRMNKAARRLEVPLLVVLGTRDLMVRNDAIREKFVARYPGPVKVVELDSEHYVDFTEHQPTLAREVEEWVLTHSGDRR
jgi:alpha-beta hydrolase superfamily lysophospholipase